MISIFSPQTEKNRSQVLYHIDERFLKQLGEPIPVPQTRIKKVSKIAISALALGITLVVVGRWIKGNYYE